MLFVYEITLTIYSNQGYCISCASGATRFLPSSAVKTGHRGR